jgi:hypothetical protein
MSAYRILGPGVSASGALHPIGGAQASCELVPKIANISVGTPKNFQPICDELLDWRPFGLLLIAAVILASCTTNRPTRRQRKRRPSR